MFLSNKFYFFTSLIISMHKDNHTKSEDISAKLAEGFKKVREKLIEEEKKENGYLIIGDKNGNVIKIPAKDL
jgi:hypothetical protein